MSTFHARVSEVTIEMDGLHITTVSATDTKEAAPDEAQIGDFHMSLFTAAEWIELSGLIEKAIREVTADSTIRARGTHEKRN
jgi:hypothetical protein